MGADCKNTKKLNMYGFGVPGQGFYSIDLPNSKGKIYQATGILTVLNGEASEEKIDNELKNLVRDSWDFKVRNMSPQEYIVVFPDKTSLDTFAKLNEFEMSLYGLKGKLEKSVINPETSSVLKTIWIKIHNVPPLAREVDIVKELTHLVVEPLVVDELSLIRAEPVRVQGRCRNPTAVKGSIEVFFNGVGVFLRFEVEEGQKSTKGGKGDPPGPGYGPGGSGPSGSSGGKDDHDRQFKGDKSRRGGGKFDRIGKVDKERDSSHDGSMDEHMGEVPQDDNPIAAFHPQFGLMSMIMPTNLDSSEKPIQLGDENVDSGKFQLGIV
jgi:hypothetical protein